MNRARKSAGPAYPRNPCCATAKQMARADNQFRCPGLNRRRPLYVMAVSPMSIDSKLLDILCCPVTKIPVAKLSKPKLKRLNAEIEAGNVKYVDGSAMSEVLVEALVTENGTTVYPVEDDIPIMLPDKGIPTSQIDGFKHIR